MDFPFKITKSKSSGLPKASPRQPNNIRKTSQARQALGSPLRVGQNLTRKEGRQHTTLAEEDNQCGLQTATMEISRSKPDLWWKYEQEPGRCCGNSTEREQCPWASFLWPSSIPSGTAQSLVFRNLRTFYVAQKLAHISNTGRIYLLYPEENCGLVTLFFYVGYF